MKGYKSLIESEHRWISRMGAWFPEEGRVVFRGKDLFHELKDLSWMALLFYGMTGRIFNEKQMRLFEGIWTLCTSYPEPRIWNNRIAALAGTTRSTATLAISAATAVSEATIYGHRPIVQAIDFLFRAQEKLETGVNLEEFIRLELKQYRVIPGYGRPGPRKDERIEPAMALASELGFASGPYVKLAFDIQKILSQGRWRLDMSIAALSAALHADQGISTQEYRLFAVLNFSAGMFPCYLEASEKTVGTFFPLSCHRIQYEGKLHRVW